MQNDRKNDSSKLERAELVRETGESWGSKEVLEALDDGGYSARETSE